MMSESKNGTYSTYVYFHVIQGQIHFVKDLSGAATNYLKL